LEAVDVVGRGLGAVEATAGFGFDADVAVLGRGLVLATTGVVPDLELKVAAELPDEPGGGVAGATRICWLAAIRSGPVSGGGVGRRRHFDGLSAQAST
jgi:hypothetical protein